MIREIQDTDYEQVASLLQQVFPTHNRFESSSPHEIIGYLLTLKDPAFVYEKEQQIVGFFFLVQNKQNAEHSIFKYRHLAFSEEAIGKELITFAENHAKTLSVTAKVELTIAENEKEISLYEQMGYSKEAVLSNHYRMGESCYIFAKTLE